MKNTVSIKYLRNNMAEVASKVEKGESFVVMRRSKPSFKVVPVDTEDEKWVTIVDFTDGGKKEGEPAEKVLKALKELIEEDGSN